MAEQCARKSDTNSEHGSFLVDSSRSTMLCHKVKQDRAVGDTDGGDPLDVLGPVFPSRQNSPKHAHDPVQVCPILNSMR